MVHAIAANFPFTGGESLVLYQPSPLERYLPIAPGIEVSARPHEESSQGRETGQEALGYNRKGQMDYSKRKGLLVDTCL